MAIVRLGRQVTYDRSKTGTNRSFSRDPSTAVEENGVLIIASDCASLSVSTSKQGHVASLGASLHPTKDYIAEILPGDWVLAWMTQDETDVRYLIEQIQSKKQANFFDDGLKFVGRVDSIREVKNIDRNTGTLTVRYSLNASAFTELDSAIIYDARLNKQEEFGEWLTNINGSIRAAVFNQEGSLDINEFLPLLINIFMGKGPGAKSANPADNVDLQRSPNVLYLVPDTIGKLLGRSPSSSPSGLLSYPDLMDTVIGVQHFSNTEDDFKTFIPEGMRDDDGTVRRTPVKLAGSFYPSIPTLNGTPVWSVLKQYLNPAVNEMYTCLRVDLGGSVIPQLIIRQLPFTTDLKVSSSFTGTNAFFNTDINSELVSTTSDGLADPTRYSELPRWKLPPEIVWSSNIGRTNANRFNYVEVATVAPVDSTYQRVRNPPLRDDIDVFRSALRPYSMTVNCSILDAKVGVKQWTDHLADYLMGQHLTLNGSITCLGIQVPICEGDNLEFEGVVYHIESVQHNCFMDQMGRKNFETALTLSHGMANEEMVQEALQAGSTKDEAQYPRIAPTELARNPGIVSVDKWETE